MSAKRLRRLRQALEGLRRAIANMPSRKVENFARALGRRRAKRGSEPTWISDLLPNSRPLSIPHHSKNLKRGTATNILDQLERDLVELEAMYEGNNARRNGHE